MTVDVYATQSLFGFPADRDHFDGCRLVVEVPCAPVRCGGNPSWTITCARQRVE